MVTRLATAVGLEKADVDVLLTGFDITALEF
jgi:hypothetical protein